MQPRIVEMIQCNNERATSCITVIDSQLHSYCNTLTNMNITNRSRKLVRNTVWYKVSFIASSFAEWKVIWIRSPQNDFTMVHFNRR